MLNIKSRCALHIGAFQIKRKSAMEIQETNTELHQVLRTTNSILSPISTSSKLIFLAKSYSCALENHLQFTVNRDRLSIC